MIEFGNKNGDLRSIIGRRDTHRHAEISGEAPKLCRTRIQIASSRHPFDALEKNPCLHVAMLVSVKDIAASLEDPTGNAGNESGLVRTMKKSDKGDWVGALRHSDGYARAFFTPQFRTRVTYKSTGIRSVRCRELRGSGKCTTRWRVGCRLDMQGAGVHFDAHVHYL